MAASQKVQPDPFPEATGRSIPPIHTKTQVIQTDPYVRITMGRSIPAFWRTPMIYIYILIIIIYICTYIWYIYIYYITYIDIIYIYTYI